MKIGSSFACVSMLLIGCHSNPASGPGNNTKDPMHDGGAPAGDPLVIAPANPVLQAAPGVMTTQQFTATLDGKTVNATWTLDTVLVGTIDSASGLFTANGTSAGKATVTATSGTSTGSTTVSVQIVLTQNGDPSYSSNPPAPGAGGYGGVGGDGAGGPVTPTQQGTLGGTPTADTSVTMLYPYDGTVWPTGLLAPLLQWNPGSHHFDSVYVHFQENGFEYKGYFAANNATSFVNLPVPAAAWNGLATSNQGDAATVTLVFGEGANAVGPYTMSWKFAPATLKGNVYYNSYGTYLVTNSDTPDISGKRYGAATLSIKPGDTAPTIVAGVTSASDGTGCRVCHTVSADGKTLLTQASNGDASNYADTRFLDLLNDTTMGSGSDESTAMGAYPALSPDGSTALSSSGGFSYPASGAAASQLFSIAATGASTVTAGGIDASFQAQFPVFSPDGMHVAFNFWNGTVGGMGGADQKSLFVMDYDPTMKAFSNAAKLYTPAAGAPVTFSSFLPTGTGIVFQVELTNPANSFGYTWRAPNGSGNGNTGELWWVDVKTMQATRLDKLNGLGYAPDNGAAGTHPPGLDATLNYEPTVNPIASGGYAWVVFTSRRMYGNVAQEDPWMSDPRKYDATSHITDKKLWVAAIDLNAAPGTDPSHPAFYLPAQEIHAGNARGYWTTGPCQADGTSCSSGDQCCGGYCPVEGGGTCSSTPPSCAAQFDKCNTDADCCNSNAGVSCINHICTLSEPPIS